MNTTMQVTRKTQPGFLQVLAGEPSEAEIEERYLDLARRLLLPKQTEHKAA